MNGYDGFEKRAPFPYFGGKRKIVPMVWERFGKVKQYIEPFCGSAAMLLGNPHPASLEVIGDASRHIANFWRAVKFQPEAVARWADYPVSHLDLAARHRWLTCPHRVAKLDASLADPEWHGDAQIAGWWVWGQCAWIGSGWCEKTVGNVGDAGRGIHSQIPHVSDAGRGIQSKIPHVGNAGRPRGTHIARWMRMLSDRLEDVRIIHGSWDRCLNMTYGCHEMRYVHADATSDVGIFFDPPYLKYEKLYAHQTPVAAAVAKWCAGRPDVKIALCGHVGDYDETLKGGTTIIDYLEAQKSWYNSQILYYESIFYFRKSFIQLQYTTGKIQDF
jgi:DNA adenine methylase